MSDPVRPQLAYAKGFYKVGEVAALTGLESHVVRYWETEFSVLAPQKTQGGQRRYRPADIELIRTIKELLHEQGYTIVGARRRLEAGGQSPTDPMDTRVPLPGPPESLAGVSHDHQQTTEMLGRVRQEIGSILTLMRANDDTD